MKQSSLPISNINTNTLCQQYLHLLYQNIYGHGVSDRQNTNISETYGEILYKSMDVLLSEIPLSAQDVFFDLGSGLGKVVIQVFLNSAVKESCGIEIIPELYQKSHLAAQKVQHELPDFYLGGRKLTFLLGSFLDISLATASVVLIGSPCFSQDILYPLGKIIDSMPSIHSVLTLRPIGTLKHFSFKKVIRIECSWDTALCYVYKRRA
jgi:hypothetical protein